MRNAIVQLILVIIGISSIHAVHLLQTSSFHIRTYPANGAERVWAIQGKDSIEMTNVNGEFFLRSIKPGQWKVSVEAARPFRDVQFSVGEIKPGFDRDLGEIRLRSYTGR
ncbi:MAG TPA: hypothetical protein VL727_22645 [Puia sp.]|nr:hypothetical protein [Puia sp.]